MEIPKEVVAQIQSLEKPLIIGVSGIGGSGKSTFAHMLSETLGAPVVGVDSFMQDRTADYSLWEGVDFARLQNEVLVACLAGANPVRYGHFDWGTNGIIKTEEVQHNGILIVEGVGLFRPEINEYFGYKVWVECPQDEAIARGKKRDREVHQNPQDEKWDGLWKKNDEEYVDTYKPREVADFVFNNA